MFYDPKWDKQLDKVLKPARRKPLTAPEAILAAMDLIKTKGWVRQEFKDEGKYCIVGAINYVLHRKPSDTDFEKGRNHKVAAEAIMRVYNTLPFYQKRMLWCGDDAVPVSTKVACDYVTGFNDYHGQEKREVIAAMKRAAKN